MDQEPYFEQQPLMDPYTNHTLREDFCGACLALPLAFAGAAGAGSTSDPNTSTNRLIFWGSIILTIASIVTLVWYLNRCKSCSSSRCGSI